MLISMDKCAKTVEKNLTHKVAFFTFQTGRALDRFIANVF